jgi:hypothetical protein
MANKDPSITEAVTFAKLLFVKGSKNDNFIIIVYIIIIINHFSPKRKKSRSQLCLCVVEQKLSLLGSISIHQIGPTAPLCLFTLLDVYPPLFLSLPCRCRFSFFLSPA